MGYLTYHKLSIRVPEVVNDFEAQLEKYGETPDDVAITQSSDNLYLSVIDAMRKFELCGIKGFLYEIWAGDSNSTKWYDHEVDMREFSKEFPSVLFVLDGKGADSGDVWIKYFKNGKMQACPAKITFDEYDESKLQ